MSELGASEPLPSELDASELAMDDIVDSADRRWC